MSNGDDVIVCCILGICCAARSAKQRAAVVKMLKHQKPYLAHDRYDAAAIAFLEANNYFEGVSKSLDEACA